MEGKKQPASSTPSSSPFHDIFSSKESPSSAILKSIFSPSSKAEVDGVDKQKSDSFSNKRHEEAGHGTPNKDVNPYYQEEIVKPSHFSDSMYYGGRDVYILPKNSQNSTQTTFNKDGGEDDPNTATRGNWWQGSLYY